MSNARMRVITGLSVGGTWGGSADNRLAEAQAQGHRAQEPVGSRRTLGPVLVLLRCSCATLYTLHRCTRAHRAIVPSQGV